MTVPACSSGTFDHSAATLECHAADIGYDTPIPSHINRSGHFIMLSIDVKSYTGSHNYMLHVLGADRPRNPVSSFHTKSSS